MVPTSLPLLAVLPLVDAGLRGGAIALFVLATAVFLNAPATLPSRFGAALAQCGIMASLAGLPNISSVEILGPLVALCSSACVPLFRMFAHAWFDDEFRPGWHDGLLGFAYIGLGLVVYLQHEGPGTSIDGVDILSYCAGTAMALNALWLAWKSRKVDLVEPRRKARSGFVMIVSVIILWLTWSEVAGRLTGAIAVSALTGALVLFAGALGLLILLVGLRHPDMFPAPGYAPASLPATQTAVAQKPIDEVLKHALDCLMIKDRAFRDPDLTIGMIAARTGAPEYKLRRMINSGLGYRNVSEYLNGFRLHEVCDALADVAQADVPITTIAMDAGFGSLAVFNRTFKAQLGETPSFYRKRHANAASRSAAD